MRTPNEIIKGVCQKYGMPKEELLKRDSTSYYVRARKEATFILRSELKLSYPHIARLLNYKDHTSAKYNFETFIKQNEPKSSS